MPNRTSLGTLQWNPEFFPSGFPQLGRFIHGLGLKFGVYSDTGIRMCSPGLPQAGSLSECPAALVIHVKLIIVRRS